MDQRSRQRVLVKRVLITGAAGYLGRHLCQALSSEYEIVAQVRPGCLPIQGVSKQIDIDLTNSRTDWSTALEGVSQVVCLAGPDASQCAADPCKAVRVNVESLVHLISQCKMAGIERLVYVSTIHVYGMPLPLIMDESTPADPRHPYAVSKLAAEYFLRSSGLTTVVARLSNSFGAPLWDSESAWKLVANDMCRQAATSHSIQVESPLQHRNLIPIRTAIAALRHLMTLPLNNSWQVYNVGGPTCFSMQELAELVARRCVKTLGVEAKVFLNENSSSSPKVDFRIDKLLASGFSLIDALESEIDDCLKKSVLGK